MSDSKHIIDNSRSALTSAWADIVDGLNMFPLWGRLGWTDILQRYRRSILGPLWLTISMAVMIAALGFLYASLFKMEIDTYLPFLTIGFVLWQMISGILLDGCTVFIGAEGVIKQVNLPLSLHVYRVLWRNFLTFLHNAVVIFAVIVIFDVPVEWSSLFALAGLAILILNGIWVALLLGLLCARFRDLNPIIGSIVQLSFFVTPIIWNPVLIPDKKFILFFNPFFHFVESVRAPLMGGAVPVETWLVLIGIAVVGWAIVIPTLGVMKRQLVYWL